MCTRIVARNVEEAVLDTPAAAEREGNTVAGQGDLVAVWVDPVVVGVIGKGLLYGVYCAVDIGFCHASYCDGH